MKKNSTTLGKQRLAILIIAAVAVVLAVVYIILVNVKHSYSVTLPLKDEIGDTLDYRVTAEKGGTVKREIKDGMLVCIGESELNVSSSPYIFPEIDFNALYAVKVENANGTYTLYRDMGTGTYLFEGCEMLSYNAEAVSTLKITACVMLSDTRLDETYDTDEALVPFGLDEASKPVRVTVRDLNENAHTVLIGSQTVSGSGYYAMEQGRPYVYVLPNDASVFFAGLSDYLTARVLPPISQTECQYIEEFDINRFNAPFLSVKLVPEEKRADTSDSDLHKVVYPAAYSVDPIGFYDALMSFENLVGTSVEEVNVLGGDAARAEEIFAKYGFNQPTNDVYFTVGGKEYRFLSGSSFEDEMFGTVYYVYSPATDSVVTLPLDTAPFLGYDLLKFINPCVFQTRIDDVAHLTIKAGDNSATYDFEGTGKELIVTERASGEKVDVPSFRQLYIAMLSVRIDGYAENTAKDTASADAAEQDTAAEDAAAAVAAETGAEEVVVSTVAPGQTAEETETAQVPEVSFSVTTRYGETYAFEFPIISTTRSRIVIGGDAEFYTNRSNVTKIADKFKAFLNGETLLADW